MSTPFPEVIETKSCSGRKAEEMKHEGDGEREGEKSKSRIEKNTQPGGWNESRITNSSGAERKKKMNTWAYCEIKSVFSVCVPKRASHRSEPWAEKRNSLSHKEGISQHSSSGKNKYLFIKIAFSFPAKSNEDHTQNLPPALDYQLFNHNQIFQKCK